MLPYLNLDPRFAAPYNPETATGGRVGYVVSGFPERHSCGRSIAIHHGVIESGSPNVLVELGFDAVLTLWEVRPYVCLDGKLANAIAAHVDFQRDVWSSNAIQTAAHTRGIRLPSLGSPAVKAAVAKHKAALVARFGWGPVDDASAAQFVTEGHVSSQQPAPGESLYVLTTSGKMLPVPSQPSLYAPDAKLMLTARKVETKEPVWKAVLEHQTVRLAYDRELQRSADEEAERARRAAERLADAERVLRACGLEDLL